MATAERAPDSLLPVWGARLAGFAALGTVGALEWRRMIAGVSLLQALLWVLAGLAAGGALVACRRARSPRLEQLAALGVAAGGVVLAYIVSGAPVRLLLPPNWGDLGSTIGTGARALGTVKLPYDALNPEPRIALEVLGAGLLLLAALLALWPRRRRARERGFPFLALGVLLIVVAAPVVSQGGARPLVLGALLATLCIAFLWLDRLPLRPGLGVAVLLGIALAGALPLAAAASRDNPWFDYETFAENIGPADPIHFGWNQSYGPVSWPRQGNEVLRIKSPRPLYWKAENLEDFDGTAWRERLPGAVQSAGTADVPEDWQDRPSWTSTIQVEVRRMTSHDLIAAGATMSVWDSSRNVQRSGLPGTYTVPGGLHRGDSYTAQVHVPEPVGGQLDAADTGQGGQEADDLVLEIPFRKHEGYTFHQIGRGGRGYVRHAEVHFRPFDQGGGYAVFPRPDVSSFHLRRIMRRSKYWRTYQLAMRLRRHAKTPLDYILAVNHYLQHGFAYSEHPPPVAAGHAPLDAFLFDTKEGYCQHFSGAMALLLRMGGIPSRVATGFSPGGYSTRYQAWIVRDTDAHAWVEAWFDNIGWVTYDPTPSETPARSQIFALADTGPSTTRSGASPGALPAGAAGDARRPSNFLRPDLAFDRQAGSSKPGEAAAALRGSGPSFWLWALIVLLAGGAAGAIASLARRRGDARTPLERSVDELDEALRRAGRPQPTGTTLRQLERLFGGSEDAVVYLRALSAARYGPAPDPPTPAQRRRLRRALGDGLGWWGRVRAWWALPPRGR